MIEMKVTTIVLAILCIVCILTTTEPTEFTTLKQKYTRFLKLLPPDKRPGRAILTGTSTPGELGSNVNKGYEISVCLDQDVNSMFHVLLHEIAHGTVKEYEHSKNFWNSFANLKKLAVDNGMYTPVKNKEFCGKKIND